MKMISSSKAHVVAMVPSPGLGHINACMALAEALHKVAEFSITLILFERTFQTHRADKRLRPIPAFIHLEVLPDGKPAPDNTTSYVDLFANTDTMRAELASYVAEIHPLVACIISDMFLGPVTDPVAEEYDIPRVDMLAGSATAYLMTLALPELLLQGYYSDKQAVVPDKVAIAGLPDPISYQELMKIPVDTIRDVCLPGIEANLKSKRMLLHSVYELESIQLDSIKKHYGVEAVAVGPLVQQDVEDLADDEEDVCLTWLDLQPASSVVYVSFGSNVPLTRDEAAELALGLESSGSPFLWVIRPDAVDGQADISDILPSGFLERAHTRGMIVPWAPQPAVLAHPAVGGFLSHCGWNSTMESLWNGVPMLTCPRGAEQHINARFVNYDWRAGIPLPSILDRDVISESVKELLAGHPARSAAQELMATLRSAVSRGGSSHSNLAQLSKDIINLFRS